MVLINPTYDGFNLVAKEALLLGDLPSVVLSRTAGAYEQLARAVVPVDPFDVNETGNALEVRAQPHEGASFTNEARPSSMRCS